VSSSLSCDSASHAGCTMLLGTGHVREVCLKLKPDMLARVCQRATSPRAHVPAKLGRYRLAAFHGWGRAFADLRRQTRILLRMPNGVEVNACDYGMIKLMVGVFRAADDSIALHESG
jgi:hypothetical protein